MSSLLLKWRPAVKRVIGASKAFTIVETEWSSPCGDNGITGSLLEYKGRSLGGRVACGLV